MIQSLENNIIISVTTKYVSNITDIMKTSAIEHGSSVDPANVVNIIGTVVSLPKTISKKGYEGFSKKDIKVGDTAIFRYDLIYDFIELGQGIEPIYKNRVWYNGEEYWNCDIKKVFGVIRKGEIKMVNGYVMLFDYETFKIILPAHMSRKARGAQQSIVMHIGKPLANKYGIQAKMGDAVFFNPNKAALYQIKGKPFRIIQQDKILAKLL